MELNELGKLLGERNKSGNGYQIHLNSGNIDTSCGKSMDCLLYTSPSPRDA